MHELNNFVTNFLHFYAVPIFCTEEDAGCTGHEQQRDSTKTALQSSFTSQQGKTVRHVIAHNSGAIPSCYESLKKKVMMETAE